MVIVFPLESWSRLRNPVAAEPEVLYWRARESRRNRRRERGGRMAAPLDFVKNLVPAGNSTQRAVGEYVALWHVRAGERLCVTRRDDTVVLS